MLTELSDLQESDEDVWGTSKVSFTIDTRSEEGDELIEREYTFSYAEPWDKWMFHEFEERRTPNTTHITSRNWRRTRHVIYTDGDVPEVNIPPEVTEQLEEMLGLEEMTIQAPGPIQ